MASPKFIPCISNKAFHILNCAFLILVLIFQSFVLNSYIISYTTKQDVGSYLWFLGDLIVAGMFVTMTVKAYSYLSEQKLQRKKEDFVSQQVFQSLQMLNVIVLILNHIIHFRIQFVEAYLEFFHFVMSPGSAM